MCILLIGTVYPCTRLPSHGRARYNLHDSTLSTRLLVCQRILLCLRQLLHSVDEAVGGQWISLQSNLVECAGLHEHYILVVLASGGVQALAMKLVLIVGQLTSRMNGC